MEDRPKIPFVRKLYGHLTDDEIKEAEVRLYDFYEWLKETEDHSTRATKNIDIE